MSIKKRFDKGLFDKTDKPAKTAAKNLFKGFSDWSIKDNPEQTGVDLLVYYKNKHICNIETEIKLVWSGSKFPYINLQIPERKKRYALNPVPTLFVVFNSDCSAYLSAISDDVYASPLVEVPNKYVFKGEYFFQVPLNKVYNNSVRVPLVEMKKLYSNRIDRARASTLTLKSKRHKNK